MSYRGQRHGPEQKKCAVPNRRLLADGERWSDRRSYSWLTQMSKHEGLAAESTTTKNI